MGDYIIAYVDEFNAGNTVAITCKLFLEIIFMKKIQLMKFSTSLSATGLGIFYKQLFSTML